jgi:hypothetical protein
MDIEIIDNFLDKESFENIKNTMFSSDFPWFYNKTKVSKNEEQNLDNFQFTHSFYDSYTINSNFFNLLNPIIKKVNPISIARIKANMTMRTQDILEYGYHTDYTTSTNLKTAVFYLNANNGYTKFKDGDSVDSIENRMLIFDSQMLHTGTSCTDQRFRSVINFNFYA